MCCDLGGQYVKFISSISNLNKVPFSIKKTNKKLQNMKLYKSKKINL